MMRSFALAVGLSAAALAAPSALAAVTSDVPPDTVWTMHTIVEGAPGSGQYAGSDGVDLVDINDDDLPDVVSGYEQGHRVSVSLNPGGTAVTDPWPTVKLPAKGRILGPEDAVFADVDDDGAADVIVGAEAGRRVTILFAPTNPANDRELLDAANWMPVDVAASLSVNMATMRVQWEDMNGDGDKDILVGGKETSTLAASLGYYTSTDPRNGGSWTYHSITPAGWVQQMLPVDMDDDDDLDIVYTDRDPINIVPPGGPVDRSRRGLRWLENSGGSTPTWTAHAISPVESLHKWFSVVNWDADSDLDLVDCRSDAAVHETAIWLNAGNSLSWTKVVVPIPADVGWCQHATVADVDGVGGKDLAFSYSHAGDLSGVDDLSGVVWLKNTGTPGAPSWERHEIGGAGPGIKYDNLIWSDLDDDGDLDALTSEQHEDTDSNNVLGPGLGVIWYENPEM
jgi:hypothetical protein